MQPAKGHQTWKDSPLVHRKYVPVPASTSRGTVIRKATRIIRQRLIAIGVRGQGSGQGSGTRDQESGVRNQGSGVRGQEPGIRSQGVRQSGIGDQKSEVEVRALDARS